MIINGIIQETGSEHDVKDVEQGVGIILVSAGIELLFPVGEKQIW